ncbi:RND family efflux transporter MFP subunit [Arcticibacter tournemirensis]|uniref:Efflux RND transporter periplasmic adaptor subunit n=1 Tax=Arcticibacter tournemirensis TaxID=699437 RepID=A0A4Q0M6I9_9SPHI|nr:efflux RND transporter periplasmic adaptor subunit [Arcticibacter tournemirensis]KAA8482611.1 efflux RND transporter periplasmic adaptor subunit [Arcticibacter tournemirensis]RXF68379.1 efflux RND transporter periplasmic adaptor subunit [Arcticibacter tournemirensis]TQM52586.1 RND family efflux transporter MFP subunit [Arcticibacter tournemirensis]
MKKRSIITVIVVVLVLALIAWVLQNNKKSNQAKTAVVAEGNTGAVAVKTETAKTGTVDLDFSANGNFAANQDLTLSAENSGRVTRITVDEGDHVQRGQVVARIDDELLSVEAQAAQANYQNAVRDLERYESSFKTGGVTQQQVDAMRLNVRNALARVQTAKRKSNDADIKAPISGIVNKRFIEKGSFVSPGTQLFEIVDLSKLKLKVTANETQVVNLKVGDRVKITSKVFPEKEFTGKISFIAPKADNSLNFPVEIEVSNNSGNELKAGMYGTAVFDLPQQRPVITVPRTAFAGSVNSNKVFVLDGSTARSRNVTPGRIAGERVEILEGLKEGETVITSGQVNLTDGTQVQAVK